MEKGWLTAVLEEPVRQAHSARRESGQQAHTGWRKETGWLTVDATDNSVGIMRLADRLTVTQLTEHGERRLAGWLMAE